ncbi:DUF1097 family protein [Nocardioides sp. InS609-2]|uniref:DUF1097 family protein n=1 Tax=Nocardioides sp. InS609-2 TaxID=2760705 RepID=UPI0020C0801D|nr:DUF1097 family protein [Nocardioides sp. InS609-2]
MTSRLKAAAPLAIVIAVLALIWVEFSLNFTFHWVTSGDLGNGLSLPASFHLIVPTAFVSWGLFFAAGADSSALQKVAVASVVGTLGGLFVMALAPEVADLPDFWGIAVVVAVAAFLVVMVSVVGDWYYVPGIFGAFAATIFWWIATGLDNWAPDGGGVGNSVKALGDPATAGAGAFGGVLSTPYVWVWVNTLVTLLIGCALGLISVKLTGILTPAAKPDREAAK